MHEVANTQGEEENSFLRTASVLEIFLAILKNSIEINYRF